jgi:DNA-binding MarR family transcriptional regulator
MYSISQGNLNNLNGREGIHGGARRAAAAVQEAMRATVTQLSLLNHQVGGRLELRPGDLYCLDLIASDGPLSPTSLARMTGLHPATMTGVLDRLERGRWIVRERDPDDRRGVRLRALRERGEEITRLYSGMNDALDRICDGYTHAELDLIAEFLTRTAEAGRAATEDLARD